MSEVHPGAACDLTQLHPDSRSHTGKVSGKMRKAATRPPFCFHVPAAGSRRLAQRTASTPEHARIGPHVSMGTPFAADASVM